MLSRPHLSVGLVMILAGCGGGGAGSADDPLSVVSASPAAPEVPVKPSPSPAPVSAPAPQPDPPAPSESRSESPLPGNILVEALFRGVPIDEPPPASSAASPGLAQRWFFNHTRVVTAPDGSKLHYFASVDELGSGVPYEERATLLPVRLRQARVALQTTATSINVVAVNDIRMPTSAKPIPDPVELGKPVGEWVNGEYFVRLVPRVVGGNPELFQVCWEYRMPDLPTVVPVLAEAGGAEQIEVAPGPPLSRIQCSQHRRSDAVDVGATVEEGGTIYRGDWTDDPAVLPRR